MPVEHVPTQPAGPRGRGARLSAVAPIVALPLVVLLAWAGTGEDANDAERQVRDGSSPATEREALERADAPVLPGMDLSVAPRVAFRLTVENVPQTLARRHAGEIRAGLVAVAGYLTVEPWAVECGTAGGVVPSAAFCRRSAILTARTDPILTVNWNENGQSAPSLGTPRSHLHPQILPGTALPPELVSRPDPRVREHVPVAVVVIGRFDDPRARDCQPGRRHCGEEFVLERVAWANGDWVDRPVAHDPAIPAAGTTMSSEITRQLTSRESDRGEVILSEALLTVGLLRDIDPAAAAALGNDARGPVWYVRSIGRAAVGADERRALSVAWAVLDHRTGLVLATNDLG